MKTKNWLLMFLTAVLLSLPVSAAAADLCGKLIGTYSTTQQNFVTVKRLTFKREKDGTVKILGALVGFPEEVSIGEAVAEPYADRGNKNAPNTILASFKSERYKPFIIITPASPLANGLATVISFTCYMHDVDGARIYVSGNLSREPDLK